MKEEIFEVDSSFKFDESYDSECFLKTRIKLMHNKTNPNKSNFEVPVMLEAQNSLKNKPILGRMIEKSNGEDDFNSHDIETNISEEEGEFKISYKYIEKIIGIIPETNNYEIKTEDGKEYVFVDGYIFKGYSNGADDIFERDGVKKVSMEILVDDFEYDEKEDVYDIKKYRHIGVTILGDHVGTGMVGTEATTIVKYEKTNDVYEKMLYVLNEELENAKINEEGVDNMDTKIPENEVIEEPIVTEEPVVEPEKILESVLETAVKDDDKSSEDAILSETKKELESTKKQNEEYTLKNKELEIEKANILAEFEEHKVKYSELVEKLNKYEEKEKEKEVDKLINEFGELGFTKEEISTFKEKAKEISTSELEKELVFALGIKNREKAKNFSSTKEEIDTAKKVIKPTEEFQVETKVKKDSFPLSEDLKKDFEKIRNKNQK